MDFFGIISYICVALLIILILIFIESYRECHKFRITHYDIDTGLGNESDIKILMISDLHNINHFGKENEKLLKFVSEYKPDAIVLAGDMIVSHKNVNKANIKTARFLNKLNDIADVYYGMGNHEKYYTNHGDVFLSHWNNYMNELSDEIHLLQNQKAFLNKEINEKKVCIYGLDLPTSYYVRFKNIKLKKEKIIEYIGNKNDKEYNILIAHNPEFFDTYVDWGADLILAGHNHGGLIKLPFLGGVLSPRLHIFPRFDYGLFRKNKSTMILSNGLGAHSIRIRVNNVPEVVCIHIS